jgi:ergothioneine biosynthesis protein EgtB
VSVPRAEQVVASRAREDRSIDPATLASRFCQVRAHTEALAAPLSGEDQTVQSMPDVSPTKWHRAHTTWFFETFVLRRADPRYREFDPHYSYLFNSYYEAVGARHPRAERGLLSRPGIEEIAAYRRHVDGAMLDLIDTLVPEHLALVELGLHHEQQHQELLLMDIKHVLSTNPMRPAYRPEVLVLADDDPVGWCDHPGGLVAIGHDGDGFAFDNELPRHLEYVEPYAIADRTVSSGDWLAFIEDGGYARPELWLSDGWAAVQTQRWEAPLYWERDGDSWQVFTLSGMHPVDPAAPVCHISYYEADAFAHWSGARLPTEVEWEAASVSAHGPSMFGDVWQWTGSAYLPYPRFRPAPGAVGEYNGKFMVNQHVLRGGCAATPDGHVRATYRNFFPPGSRWAFSGARLARDA